MIIRKATPDDRLQIAPLVYTAIHEISYSLIGTSDQQDVLVRLAMWIGQRNNRLSYENIWVAETEKTIAGILIAYHGEQALRLDAPIKAWLRANGQPDDLDVETSGNVHYIDSVAVDAAFGGRGIGTELIRQAIAHAQDMNIPHVTLNVDQTNPAAGRLYERLGFMKEKEIEISGGRFDYMTFTVSENV